MLLHTSGKVVFWGRQHTLFKHCTQAKASGEEISVVNDSTF